MSDAIVDEIAIFPVKSCTGFTVPRARVEKRGLASDRRLMIVDDAGQFMTQRETPVLREIKVTMDDASIVLTRGDAKLVLPREEIGEPRRVRVWRSEVDALDQGEEAAEFVTRIVGLAARIVRMPKSTKRQINPEYGGAEDIVSFADGYPILAFSRASLDDLSARAGEPLDARRFRANIVLRGCAPYEEDAHREMSIRGIAFRATKPCSRCVIIARDPDTGKYDKAPLKTLATYREKDGEVFFGHNFVPDREGEIAVGDEVTFHD